VAQNPPSVGQVVAVLPERAEDFPEMVGLGLAMAVRFGRGIVLRSSVHYTVPKLGNWKRENGNLKMRQTFFNGR
jgi:hypothetical protein